VQSKSDKKEDVLSSGEVKKMLRCGVMKILDGESILMTEASVDTLIAQAHARGEQGGAGPEEDAAEVKEEEETDVFNQKLLEVRQFGGKKFESAREAMRSIADDWAAEIAASGARRERVSTVENVGGFQVKKINRSAKGPTPDQLNPKKKNPVMHDSACLYCGESGAVAHSQLNCCKAGHCHRSVRLPCPSYTSCLVLRSEVWRECWVGVELTSSIGACGADKLHCNTVSRAMPRRLSAA